ncbi:hypothetical protein DFJ77DRAFT_335925 [Powellomyces hirtus]|nr:hypothetical protein DFJ77DRAFT_335925 [Powellomyces hirtus]
MSPENPRILRYSQALLLALRKSPLIQKPEGLISVAELMSQPPERSNKNNHNHNDPTVPKTGSERASRFADKELVFGPPKMNFASAQSTGLRASEDSNDMHKVVKSPDEPQSKISVLDRTTMRPISSRSRESHGRLGLNGDDNGSHTPRLEKKPVGRDGDRPEKQVERNASVGSMRVRKDEGGSWRDRSEGTGPPRPVPVKSADPWSSGTTQPRRGQRDHHPEWMNADTEKISFSGPTTPADEEQPSSGVADDDIQRFKAQMRRRERVAKPESGQQPTGQVVNQTQNISLPPTPAVQSPSAKQQEAESVDSFFDMNFDVHRVPVNQIFEKPVNEKKSSAEKSRFARFWSEEPERPPTLHTSAPPPDTMHRIGISDLFTSARMNGPQEPYGYPAARGNLPSQNAEQRYPQMMSEDDVISAYNKNRPPMSDRSAPINPSDEDRAGINRVMEKLAVFGINQRGPKLSTNEWPYGVWNDALATRAISLYVWPAAAYATV